MFFQQPVKSGGGTPTKPAKEKSSGFAFSQYIGEDAARELYESTKFDLDQISADIEDFKTTAEEIVKSGITEVPILKSFRELSIFEDVADEQDPPDPVPPPEDQIEEEPTVEVPTEEEPLPPPIPPRIPTPAPPKEPEPIPEPIPAPEPDPVPEPIPAPEPTPVPPTPKSDPSCEEMAEMLKALEKLTSGLEAMGQDILSKVNTLESTVTCRSEEIRKDLQHMHQDAIDFGRKIKENIHDAQLKDLEIQKKTLEMMAEDEDRILERAKKYQGLFSRE